MKIELEAGAAEISYDRKNALLSLVGGEKPLQRDAAQLDGVLALVAPGAP
jgi:hypothetical protein